MPRFLNSRSVRIRHRYEVNTEDLGKEKANIVIYDVRCVWGSDSSPLKGNNHSVTANICDKSANLLNEA